jgi:uncharacterized protein (DUF2147 family)
MFRRITVTAATMMLAIGAAYADPIEGNWRTQSGETAAIGGCGGGFCITLKTGKHKGKGIGKMNAEGGGAYSGSITDPSNDKTYSGSATLSGGSLKMKGCVLGGLICRSQTWTKQ